MKPISIIPSTRRRTTCRSCGAAIEFATVATTNRPMPFNPPIVLMAALDLEIGTRRVDMTETTSHFATCPQAKQWRTRGRAR
jgi:hypothetical protein